MSFELLSLDPPEMMSGREELVLNDGNEGGAFFVDEEGPNWGDSVIEAYNAEMTAGQVPVDFSIPNRTIEIPMMVGSSTTMTFNQARMRLQQKIAVFQAQGGVLKRTLRTGEVIYLDVVNASLKMGGSTSQAQRDFDPDVVVTLETLPDWYGEEVALDALIGSGVIAQVLQQSGRDAVIRGAFPLGNRCRIVITDTANVDRLGIFAAFRSERYDPAPTAALTYQAEALQLLDTSVTAPRLGASGGTVVSHGSLAANAWSPVVGFKVGGTAALTHRGNYRIRARISSPNGTAVAVRVLWDVGDVVNPLVNERIQVPGASAFYDVDLGPVSLATAPGGTHEWSGQIQAIGQNGGETVEIDTVTFVPCDEFMAVATAQTADTPVLTAYAARDGFDQAAGALTGKALPVGGAWTAGFGGTTDFQTTGASTITRASFSFPDAGRGVVASRSTVASVSAQLDIVSWSLELGENPSSGIVARYVNLNTYLTATVEGPSGTVGQLTRLVLRKYVAGVPTELAVGVIRATYSAGRRPLHVLTNATLSLTVSAGGLAVAFIEGRGYGGAYFTAGAVARDAALGIGGALASGLVGITDSNPANFDYSGPGSTRTFGAFSAFPYVYDAVLYGGGVAELRTEGLFRDSSSSGARSRIGRTIGDLPRLPVTGKPVELLLKASVGDFGALPDSSLDRLRAQVIYRPCWLTTPA